MAKILSIDLLIVDLKPKVLRTDAIQSFECQETPIVRIRDSDGVEGIGYSYTIGTGGPSVMALLEKTLAPMLIGREAEHLEDIWRAMLFRIHALSVGPVAALAMAAIDTALWDLRCKRAKLPLHVMAGGAKANVPLYTTEGGWLHIDAAELIDDAQKAQALGFLGSKIKIGKPHHSEDDKRLSAVRKSLGESYEIMTDANQSFSLSEAIRRAEMLARNGIAWFEEPMPADDIGAHVRLAASTHVPIAVGESMYSLSQFKDYLQQGACSIVQADVARVGGITAWLKIAHMAEAFNVSICPHFLMELHVSLTCAVTNAPWLEYIPQLDSITQENIKIENGRATPSSEPGLGINWDWTAITANSAAPEITIE
jgi:L-alanine-DL-glutamate epimerase-like enolase superfamily enzyme